MGQVACTLCTSASSSLAKGLRAARRAKGKWDGKVTEAQQARRGEGLGSCSASSTSSQAEGSLPLPAPWPCFRSLQEFISTLWSSWERAWILPSGWRGQESGKSTRIIKKTQVVHGSEQASQCYGAPTTTRGASGFILSTSSCQS